MQNRYLAYLLRLFKSGSAEDAPWKVSLQDSRNMEQMYFDSLPALFQFLLDLTGTAPQDAIHDLQRGSTPASLQDEESPPKNPEHPQHPTQPEA